MRPPPAVDTVHEEKKCNLKHSVGYVVTVQWKLYRVACTVLWAFGLHPSSLHFLGVF
jgi:hypothetical protein